MSLILVKPEFVFWLPYDIKKCENVSKGQPLVDEL